MASTAIPIDKIIAAIPGKVKTIPIAEIAQSSKSTYNSKAISAIRPKMLYISIISMNTHSRPIAPAMILILSAFSPIVAVCTDEVTSLSSTGSAPPLIRAARLDASSLSKPPPLVISHELELIVLLTVGAEITSLSRTIMIALS